MGLPFFFATWWGFILQAVAIVHFIRRRPDTYWLFIILIGGWLGALVYIGVEVIPDADLLRTSFQAFPRRRRIHELEIAIHDNPSAGNYEELGLLYLDNGNFSRARACYDKAISSRTDHPDPFYRRGIAEVELGDFAAAVPDLERAVFSDPDYDFHRAKGLLAHAYAQTGQADKADAMFCRQPRSQRFQRRITTTRFFSIRRVVTSKPVSGHRNSSIRDYPCRDTFAGATALVSKAHALLLRLRM